MTSSQFTILAPPEILKNDVECFCIVKHTDNEPFTINTSPKAAAGITFQHANGHSAIQSIVTDSGTTSVKPTLFLYGAGIKPSTMNFTGGSYTSIQVILKPHAINTLFGMNASTLNNCILEPDDFSATSLNNRLLDAKDEYQQIALLTDFLITQLQQERARDKAIEESLRLIHQNVAYISVKYLLEYLNFSERQFERRFNQSVGITPQSYIRVTRFNEAVRLIKTGRYKKLTDVAYALNYYDQSHLIHDINTFSSMTPKNIAQKDDDFYHAQVGYSYS